jgi:predicted ATP-grasp superfamily ATP-dependent carboligase
MVGLRPDRRLSHFRPVVSDASTHSPALLIVGASARAAASSASRAGFAPTTIDLFADRDLTARFPAHRACHDTYPASLATIAERLPNSPWIYTGAIENHPDLIDQIACRRTLLGIQGDSLRALRHPRVWTATLAREGLPWLETRHAGDRLPSTGEWLLKPLSSASGRGIRPWMVGDGPIPPGCHLQARRRGLPLGATFVGDGRSARLLGITRQLLGPSELGLRVVYQGSIGPWRVDPVAKALIGRVGAVLAAEFAIRGLFGIDWIVETGVPWPVEINPRYTASVEVVEAMTGLSLIADHARAFGIEIPTVCRNRHSRFVAKRILFASQPGVAPTDWPWTDPTADRPSVADLPCPGTRLDPGDPVLTVFARGRTIAEVVARLKRRSRIWRDRIDGWR